MFICLTVLLCFLAGLLGKYFLYGDKIIDPVVIVIVDNDNSMESNFFYAMIKDMKEYKELITFEKRNEDEALQLLKENMASAIFTIPENFAQSVKSGENKPFSVIYNSSMPIKSEILKYFADAFTQMLTASQIGVYSALDYIRNTGSNEQYSTIFRGINLKYLNIVLKRNKMLETETIAVTGEASAFQYYFFAAYIFIMIAGVLLFVDIIQNNFRREILLRLKKSGVSSIRIMRENVCSVFVVFIFINIILGCFVFAADKMMHLGLEAEPVIIAYIYLILFTVSSLTVFISSFFRNVFSAGIFISVTSLISLVLSGGIIPVDYFPDYFSLGSKFTLNFWAVRLLNDGMKGRLSIINVSVICIFLLTFAVLSALCFWTNSKAGDII